MTTDPTEPASFQTVQQAVDELRANADGYRTAAEEALSTLARASEALDASSAATVEDRNAMLQVAGAFTESMKGFGVTIERSTEKQSSALEQAALAGEVTSKDAEKLTADARDALGEVAAAAQAFQSGVDRVEELQQTVEDELQQTRRLVAVACVLSAIAAIAASVAIAL